MEVVVKGRHTEVPERFRHHVEDKVGKVVRLDQRVSRIDVELSEERNPRLADQMHRIEMTCRSKGPVIRAEAAAADPYAALDVAFTKLETRLRRAADRRLDRLHGRSGGPRPAVPDATQAGAPVAQTTDADPDAWGGSDGPALVVREKHHPADPMTLDQALFALEMVGHDFYLFQDAEAGVPSVVYRRRGYQYGVIRLVADAAG